MSSLKRKMQRQIQRNKGTLEHKKVIARKMGITTKELAKRMDRRENNLRDVKEDN